MHNSPIKASTLRSLINSGRKDETRVWPSDLDTGEAACNLESMMQKFAGQFYKQISSALDILSVRAPVFIDFGRLIVYLIFTRINESILALCDVEAENFYSGLTYTDLN